MLKPQLQIGSLVLHQGFYRQCGIVRLLRVCGTGDFQSTTGILWPAELAEVESGDGATHSVKLDNLKELTIRCVSSGRVWVSNKMYWPLPERFRPEIDNLVSSKIIP